MSSNDVFDVVIAVAVLGFVLYRQTVARPVTMRKLWILPGILVVLGAVSLSKIDHGHLSGTAVGYLALDIASSLVLGAIRGLFVRVYAQDGVMWRQGSSTTIALWVVSILVRVGIAILASHAGVGNVSDAGLDLAFGLSLGSQNAVVAYRGMRQGIPFAPDVRRARY
jgi:hypothetical protein